jgi:glyoxylate/hydroxypyruvate reductase
VSITKKEIIQYRNFRCELVRVENEKRSSILEKVAGVDAIFWATKETLDAEILDKAGKDFDFLKSSRSICCFVRVSGAQMKTVGAMSAGVNNIDVPELKKRGIKLGNTPGVLDDAVAEIAVLLALSAARRLHEGRLKIER